MAPRALEGSAWVAHQGWPARSTGRERAFNERAAGWTKDITLSHSTWTTTKSTLLSVLWAR
ncbi:MAG TPA: hypothetical protein VII61_16575 [Ktedonobacteraceae bacterium]